MHVCRVKACSLLKNFWRPLAAIVWKDILSELRTKDVVVSTLVFALLIAVIFNLALDPTPRMLAQIAPGVLWVAFTFGGVLGLTRSFAMEKESGSLQGLLLTPVGRDVIFFGKMLGNLLFMLIVEAMVFPIFVVLFNLPVNIPDMIPIAILATIGITSVGTVFAAMAVNTRSREVMLPLLFFPVVMPIIVAAVEASGAIIQGGEIDGFTGWAALMLVFDIVFLVTCPTAFALVIDE